MRGNLCLGDLADVAYNSVRVMGKVRMIGLLAIAIPL